MPAPWWVRHGYVLAAGSGGFGVLLFLGSWLVIEELRGDACAGPCGVSDYRIAWEAMGPSIAVATLVTLPSLVGFLFGVAGAFSQRWAVKVPASPPGTSAPSEGNDAAAAWRAVRLFGFIGALAFAIALVGVWRWEVADSGVGAFLLPPLGGFLTCAGVSLRANGRRPQVSQAAAPPADSPTFSRARR